MFSIGVSPFGNFKVKLSSYSVAMLPGNLREDVDRGGKIIMPPSSLDMLTRMNVSYPMLFKMTNEKAGRVSHCGVLEFIAEDGNVYLPNWMMRNLMLEEGDLVQLENVSLPVATFSKFQPQSEDFLDIHNPKAVLENSLRQFACLTTGDVINIRYNERNYELSVLETEPGQAVSIIECDMNVDFAAPLGYGEQLTAAESEAEVLSHSESQVAVFGGRGQRLDGKERRQTDSEVRLARRQTHRRGVPDYTWRVGTLTFNRKQPKQPVKVTEDPSTSSFQPFQCPGATLKKQE